MTQYKCDTAGAVGACADCIRRAETLNKVGGYVLSWFCSDAGVRVDRIPITDPKPLEEQTDKPEICPACSAHIENYRETMHEDCCAATREARARRIMEENGKPMPGDRRVNSQGQPEVYARAGEHIKVGPGTMTASVYESSVRAFILEAVKEKLEHPLGNITEIISTATAQIMKLPGVRDSDLLKEIAQFRDEADETATWLTQNAGVVSDYELGRRAVFRVDVKLLTDLLKRHGYEG